MISNIVDSNGLLVYRGNDVDSKFATVLARTGHSRVDGDCGDEDKPKWDGSNWVDGTTALETWQKKMRASDNGMPRFFEDLITSNASLVIPAEMKKRYDAKIKIRGEKP